MEGIINDIAADVARKLNQKRAREASSGAREQARQEQSQRQDAATERAQEAIRQTERRQTEEKEASEARKKEITEEAKRAVEARVGEWRNEIEKRRSEEGRSDSYDDIELTGRGARHDESEWHQVLTRRRIVDSSNVYAYHYVPESARSGVLYVTFLYWEPGMKPNERSGPGATYAYYDFPVRKYHEFESAAATSAGKAVWDYCRRRGTVHGHQHRYYLIQAEGDYVPRKATAKGFAARSLLPPGTSPRLQRKSPLARAETLKPTKFANRGTPNRGAPNRGTPNRGK